MSWSTMRAAVPAPETGPRPCATKPRGGAVATPRVVAIGGGTGLPAILRGLRPLIFDADPAAPRDRLTAIVATSDDGGSSGTLSREYGVIPPGDIRNCLAALSAGDPLLPDLFQYRFGGENGLNGHALGNLVLTALADVTSDFGQAVELASRVLQIQGRVVPVTLDRVALSADLADGRTISGETAIVAAGCRIRRLRLSPPDPRPAAHALDAIRQADMIVAGPGSLYTSVLSPLLVPEMADALRRSSALRVFVVNLMTEPGETDGCSLSDHLRIVRRHLGCCPFDIALYNTSPVTGPIARAYRTRGSVPVTANRKEIDRIVALGVRPIGAPLAYELARGRIRHHPARLARAVLALHTPRLKLCAAESGAR